MGKQFSLYTNYEIMIDLYFLSVHTDMQKNEFIISWKDKYL